MTFAATTIAWIVVLYASGPGLRKTHRLPIVDRPHLPHLHHS
jgi:hypothetical protein